MDRRINNEALIASVIAKIVEHKAYSISQITLLVPILLNDKIRKKISHSVMILGQERAKIGLEYKELLISIMNSIILLSQSQCIYINENRLLPLLQNKNLCASINENKSIRLSAILQDLEAVLSFVENRDVIFLYNYFCISL